MQPHLITCHNRNCGNVFRVIPSRVTRAKYCCHRCSVIDRQRDLTGQRFDHWTVLGPTDERNKSGTILWRVRCECGKERLLRTDTLTCGETHSCSCQKAARIIRDLRGQRFGALLVIEDSGRRTGARRNNVIWRCICDCGKEHFAPGGELTKTWACYGRRSCGCQHERPSTRHGHKSRKNPSKEYRAWSAAKARCIGSYLPCFENYGGRGITFYEGWLHRFDLFLEHVGPAPSPDHWLDRIDNERGYEPGNVRWATAKEQCNNKRNNRLLTCPKTGLTLTLQQWADRLGCDRASLEKRLRKWSLEEALTRPLKKDRRRR